MLKYNIAIPVSYTHLDVYKRQVQISKPDKFFFCFSLIQIVCGTFIIFLILLFRTLFNLDILHYQLPFSLHQFSLLSFTILGHIPNFITI